MIFDNADRPQEIAAYRPDGAGHVLITSRYPGWGALGGRLEVDVLARTETVALLRARIPDLEEELADALAAEPQPSALIFSISSAWTRAASSLATWQVPAASWPPPPYWSISSPTLVFELRSRIDLPVANTVFCWRRPQSTWIEMLHSGNSA